MATDFQILSTDWYNELRNGGDFASDPLIKSSYFVGNVMENVRIERQIQVSTFFNLQFASRVNFFQDPFVLSQAYIQSNGVNFQSENFYPGAEITVSYGTPASTVTGQCLGFTGNGNSQLIVDSTIAAALQADIANFPRNDLSIVVNTRPTYLDYSYNTVIDTQVNPNFDSPYGPLGIGAPQTYRARDILSTFVEMYFVGGYEGCNLGSARVKFDATTDGYLHAFTIQHDFIIPYFLDGEVLNIRDLINPPSFTGTSCLKYISNYKMGINAGNLIVDVNDIANNASDTGYYGENFNANPSDFTITDVQFSVNGNQVNTIDVRETTNVAFILETTAGTFNSGIFYVLSHSRLCDANQYSGQHDPFDEVWILDQVRAKLLLPGVTSTIIQNVTNIINSPTSVTFIFDLVFSQEQQDRIQVGDDFVLAVDIATDNIGDANLTNRVQVPIAVGRYQDSTDVPDLILDNANVFWNSWSEFGVLNNFGNRLNLWDGDLMNFTWNFKTDALLRTRIQSIDFEVGFFYNNEWVVVKSFPIFALSQGSISQSEIVVQGPPDAYFQLTNTTDENGFNLPPSHLKNITVTAEIPTVYQNFQQWEINAGFYISWRDWVANANIPAEFTDYNLPNDNLNEKTSNYSNSVPSTLIQGALRLEVTSGSSPIITEYLLNTGFWTVNDFDEEFITPISGQIEVFDRDGNLVTQFYDNQDLLIVATFTNGMGVTDPATIWGRIWVEVDQTQLEPWSLSTELDWTNPSSYLKPSTQIDPLNTQFVEKEVTPTEIKLYCLTNSENIGQNINYRPYARLGIIKP